MTTGYSDLERTGLEVYNKVDRKDFLPPPWFSHYPSHMNYHPDSSSFGLSEHESNLCTDRPQGTGSAAVHRPAA